MPLALGLPLTALFVAAWTWSSHCVAVRLDGDGPAHTRLAATALVQLWLANALFQALMALQLFRWSCAAPLALALTAGVHARLGAAARRRLGDDVAAFRALVAELRRPLPALLASAVGLVVAARLLRAMVSPPLAWDALVYHDFIPATWVQTGALLPSEWPDWGRFLNYYPHGGEIVWAWIMLPVHGDALLPLATLWVWSLVGVAGFAAARMLEAPRGQALLAALALASIPAMLTEVTSGYVDTYVLAAFLLAFVFVLRLTAAPTMGNAALAAMGFGLTAAGKLSGFPSWLGGLALVTLLVARGGARGRRLGAAIVAAAVALVPTAPAWLTAWRRTGSPVYPLQLDLFGRVLVAGNRELSDVFSGRQLHIVDEPGNVARLLHALLQPTLRRDDGLPFDFMNIGIAVVPMLCVGLLGVAQLLRRPGRRLAIAAWLALASLPVAALASPALLGTRTHLAWCLGRLIVCFPATLIIVGAVVPMARLLLPLAIAGNVLLCARVPFSAGQQAGAMAFGWVAAMVAAAWVALLVATGRRRTRAPEAAGRPTPAVTGTATAATGLPASAASAVATGTATSMGATKLPTSTTAPTGMTTATATATAGMATSVSSTGMATATATAGMATSVSSTGITTSTAAPTARSVVAWTAALVAGLALVGGRLETVRARLRHTIYAETADGERPAYDMHSLMPYGAEAPIWRFVDDGGAHRLAVTYGWSGLGENLMRYPLLGSRLQNRMVYVPISADGEVFDYRDLGTKEAPALSRDAWLGRLRDTEIDMVVDGGFHPPEERWMEAEPALFREVAADATRTYRVYRVDRERLRRQ